MGQNLKNDKVEEKNMRHYDFISINDNEIKKKLLFRQVTGFFHFYLFLN